MTRNKPPPTGTRRDDMHSDAGNYIYIYAVAYARKRDPAAVYA